MFFFIEISLFAIALNLRKTQIRTILKKSFKDPGAQVCKFLRSPGIDSAYLSYRPPGGIDSWTP
jgi:hypothetical protein